MNNIFADVDVGRKNIVFGVVLFLVLGVMVGIPLTVNLFGGSMLTESQYQTWKVLHAYGVFTAFVNFFFGFLVDRMSLGRRQLEIASWSFLLLGYSVALVGRSCFSSPFRGQLAVTLSTSSRRWDLSSEHIYLCTAGCRNVRANSPRR
jgi:hypothetical protein